MERVIIEGLKMTKIAKVSVIVMEPWQRFENLGYIAELDKEKKEGYTFLKVTTTRDRLNAMSSYDVVGRLQSLLAQEDGIDLWCVGEHVKRDMGTARGVVVHGINDVSILIERS